MEAGLNLYSLRNSISTKKGFYNTCLKLKSMGYDYLQCSGMSISSNEIKDVLDKTGFSVKLTHCPLERILNDLENLVFEHNILNCDNVGVGWINRKEIENYDDAMRMVETLESAAINLKNKEKKFFYHNHDFEFVRIGNKNFYDLLIENTSELSFILDTYWVQAGGASILEYIDKLNGRLLCVHLKDYKMDDGKPRFAAIGDGNINFKNIIPALIKAGTKYFFVEQDDAEMYPDPFYEVNKSINYLKKLSYADKKN